MTTTASILHCWKKAKFDFFKWAAVICFLFGALVCGSGWAGEPVLSQFQLETNADGVYLSASVKFELPMAVEDALLKGVPMFFVAQVDIYRERWYWYDKKMLTAERHMRLAYQPLTRRWRLNIASGPIVASSLGVALNQGFDSLADALAAVQRISNWKIAELSELDTDERHNLEFRYKLDLSQLPRPFQIGALGQADWNISVSSIQRLPAKVAK